jgi:hypothetical protein
MRAGRVSARPATHRWLIEELWAEQAVGILGGEPKCFKSFLALDIALSVASGAPCLRRFPVRRSGPVLLFPAEDAPCDVRSRLDGLCAAAELSIDQLDLYLITAPRLALDRAPDRQRLHHTVQTLRPVLLVLDPLIRLHNGDENQACDIAPILAFLRDLQRRFALAVLLVHHARKDAHGKRPGQALRGSSELHGWGDSNLYLRRQRDSVSLAVEHRCAPSHNDLRLYLRQSGPALSLAVCEPEPAEPDAPSLPAPARVLNILRHASEPLGVRQLRARCRIRTQTLSQILAELLRQGRIRHTSKGYHLPVSEVSVSLPPIAPTGNGNGKHGPDQHQPTLL